MKYEILTDKDNNIIGAYETENDIQSTLLELDSVNYEKLNCSKLINGKIVLDEEKYQEYLKQKELPTQTEKVEAQVLYTALMTDTMLEG